jgi:enhanced entry protein EnhC
MKLKLYICMLGLSSIMVYAHEGVDAYRVGDYKRAAVEFYKSEPHENWAKFYIAEMYAYGYGFPKNTAKALEYYRLSADKGYLPAQQFLARYALHKDKNVEQALIWFKKAADNQDVSAMMYCAAAYKFGLGTTKNEDVSRKYYIAAAKMGNPLAQLTLAEHFLESKHGANQQLGEIWLNKACLQDYIPALLYKATWLHQTNPEQANQLLQKAIDQEYPKASFVKAQWLIEAQKWDEAQQWLHKAVDLGYEPAMVTLAELYLKPDTPIFDAKAGFKIYQQMAEQHAYIGEKRLSELYQQGIGVAADPIEAEKWLKLSKLSHKPDEIKVQHDVVQWLTASKEKEFAKTDYRLKGIWNEWQNGDALQSDKPNSYPYFPILELQNLFKADYAVVQPKDIPLSAYLDAMLRVQGPVKLPEQTLIHYPFKREHGLSKRDFEKALKEANLGAVDAQFIVGRCYLDGVGVEANPLEAKRWFEKGLRQDDLRAQYEYALLEIDGQDVQQQRHGLQLLREAAFRGDAPSEFAYGLIMEKGIQDDKGKVIVPADIQETKNMYMLATVNGHGQAQYRLAEWMAREPISELSVQEQAYRQKVLRQLYRGAVKQGITQAELPLAFFEATSPDIKKREWALRTAQYYAEREHPEAALLTGLMMEKGLVDQPDSNEARKWFDKAKTHPIGAFIWASLDPKAEDAMQNLQKAADAKFSYAYLNLAVLAHENKQPSLELLRNAVEMKNLTAMHLLANEQVLSGDKKLQENSRSLFKAMAEKGDVNAQLCLGYMLLNGLGGPVNMEEGSHWLTKAASQHDTMAEYVLGYEYHLGKMSALPDDEQAIKWMTLAAQKNAHAWTSIGYILEISDKDYMQAKTAYEKANAVSNKTANYNLGLIYEYGKGTPTNVSTADDFYTQSAREGSVKGMMGLAERYLRQRSSKALSWYLKAAEGGEVEALYRLGLLHEAGYVAKLSYDDAIQYYQQAADLGYKPANHALERINAFGLNQKTNEHPEDEARLKSIHVPPRETLTRDSVDYEYLYLLDEWNQGNEKDAQLRLDQILQAVPDFSPARELWIKMHSQWSSK